MYHRLLENLVVAGEQRSVLSPLLATFCKNFPPVSNYTKTEAVLRELKPHWVLSLTWGLCDLTKGRISKAGKL